MIQQLFHFGLIGIAALLVHWLVVALLVPLGIVPLLANIVGFLTAFQVSYWGHRRWTFNARTLCHSQTLPRFAIVSCSSFLLNEFMYFLLLRYTSLDYRTALFIVLAVVAALTYLLSRQW
ncbi:MAG: GtrA family protein, partial [Chloroflexi bacterium]|nr:GtrA family protein [Chloroflexota bacterium]